MATIHKIIQNYLPAAVSIMFSFISWSFRIPAKLDMDKIMDKSIDLASISFGFLLAVLALLLQGDSPAINRVKDSGNYPTLIELNRKAVLVSGLLVIISLIYLGTAAHEHVYSIQGYELNNTLNSLALGIIIYQLAMVLSFIDIFYFIIKQEK